MGGSGLDRTDDFQKFCGSALDRIQFYRIRTGIELKNFPVCSSLANTSTSAVSCVNGFRFDSHLSAFHFVSSLMVALVTRDQFFIF